VKGYNDKQRERVKELQNNSKRRWVSKKKQEKSMFKHYKRLKERRRFVDTNTDKWEEKIKKKTQNKK
jgi:hypothetical protein